MIENFKNSKYRSDPKKVQEYQRVLSGTLMAGVNGGIYKYKEAFLTNYDPTLEKEEIHKLKLALQEHVRIVINSVGCHKRYFKRDPMHAQFEDFLVKMKKTFYDEMHYMKFRKLFYRFMIFLVINIVWQVYVPIPLKEIIYMILLTIASYVGHTLLFFVQYLESLIGYEFPKSPLYSLGDLFASFILTILNYWGQLTVSAFEALLATVNLQKILSVTWDFMTWSFNLVRPFVENYLGDFGVFLYGIFSSVIDKINLEWTRFVISLFYS